MYLFSIFINLLMKFSVCGPSNLGTLGKEEDRDQNLSLSHFRPQNEPTAFLFYSFLYFQVSTKKAKIVVRRRPSRPERVNLEKWPFGNWWIETCCKWSCGKFQCYRLLLLGSWELVINAQFRWMIRAWSD